MGKEQYKPLRSPIKWAGGKYRLRKHIIELIPEHTCYVELFCGASWVLFGKPPSQVEVINDIDGELINFFRVIKKQPTRFVNSFKNELVSRQVFDDYVAEHPAKLSEIQRAHRFFYIIMAGWGGEHRNPRLQTSISDGGHGNRLIGALKSLDERIYPVHQRLRTVIIENLDWKACADRYNNKNTLLYVDPPYLNNGVNYLNNMKGIEEHKALASWLKKAKARWILSAYDNEETKKLYPPADYFYHYVQSYSGMRKKKRSKKRFLNREVLITNFEAG
ncbi:MAG TPA: DNA adenine methylase [Anaerolineales bacterium]|nr:DNA adenine methylase [Anaerolineales bacterium]HRQ91602.1 DNA adenine methylase [Anaerolineales bacterium]